jgi:hypothetical protein
LVVLARSVLVAALLACGANAAPVFAAASPTIRATPESVHRGHLVRVHGKVPGCPRGDRVTLISRAFRHRHDFAGLPAVFARVRAHHRYSVRTRIPSHRSPGRYTISGRCGGGNLGVSATLRVRR